ncbi:MAG: chemotaxis protein CheD [Syntrophales bacterium]
MQDKEIQLFEYFLKPGHIFMSREPALISLVLGSCVAVSIWDCREQYGGMAHYLYPYIGQQELATAKYGNVAVGYLARLFLEEGAERENIRAQIFGGASIEEEGQSISEENIAVARRILKQMQIRIVSEDVGGDLGRKLVYNTRTNEAIVYKAQQLRKGDWYPYRNEARR